MAELIHNDFRGQQELLDLLEALRRQVKANEITSLAICSIGPSGAGYFRHSIWASQKPALLGVMFAHASSVADELNAERLAQLVGDQQ